MEVSNSDKSLTRRRAFKQFSHVALGTSTAYLAMVVNYQKPSIKKMFSIEEAAAQVSSDGGGVGSPP